MAPKLKRSSSLRMNRMNDCLIDKDIEIIKYIKILLTIEDDGIGISKENLKKLFTDFTRLKEHEHLNAKGTGLGLSICKNIIEQMGGNITVESEVGVGTKFHITMGLKAVDKQVQNNN